MFEKVQLGELQARLLEGGERLDAVADLLDGGEVVDVHGARDEHLAGLAARSIAEDDVDLGRDGRFSSMRLGVLSAGTSLKTGARSRFEIFMLRRAESVVPKGCVEPVAKIGVPLSFMESLGVTRLLLELASVLTNGSSRLKSVTDWSMARARSRT